MTLGEPGLTSTRPTVPTASGEFTRAGVDEFDQPCGAEQRVVPARHRRGAGMAFAADDRDFVPIHRLHAGDDADVLALGFEERPLLDMQFEESRELVIAAALRAAIADFFQRRAERLAVAVLALVRKGAGEGAGEYAGGDHRRGKARAFLVGPVDHLDRREGLVAGAMQRAQSLQRGEDAERAVKLAAGRLGVEMAADADRRDVGPLAFAPREHAAHVVDGDGAAERLRLRLEPVAYLAVEFGQRQPADAGLRRRADLGGQHQVVPQPLRVDAQVFHLAINLRALPRWPMFAGPTYASLSQDDDTVQEASMPAYWVARSKVNDPVEYKKYTDLVPAILAKYGGKVLARGGKFQIMEGPDKFHRFIVVEFPTFEQGVACFTSPEYDRAAAFRRSGAGEVETIMVEGV